MNEVYSYKFTKEQSDFIKNNSTMVSFGGKRYFNVPDWFVEESENVFSITSQGFLPQKIKELISLQSKDQQIKELTELLEQCEVLAFQDDAEDYIERWQEYTSKVSQYRQKYPKP